jgi:hypothetical protein
VSAVFTQSALLAGLKAQAATLGLAVRDEGSDGLTGEMESIRAKWFLGGRKVSYRMSCRLAEAEHSVRFREAVVEKTWGMPPPTFSPWRRPFYRGEDHFTVEKTILPWRRPW